MPSSTVAPTAGERGQPAVEVDPIKVAPSTPSSVLTKRK